MKRRKPKKLKTRNGFAKALECPAFRPKVIPDKRRGRHKKKPKVCDLDKELDI